MYVWFRLGPDPSDPSQGSRVWVELSLIPKLFFYFYAVQGKLGLSLGSTRSIQMVYTSYDPLSFLYSNCSSTNTVKQVFANMELLGWYTTGDVPTAEDTHFHGQVCLVEREERER